MVLSPVGGRRVVHLCTAIRGGAQPRFQPIVSCAGSCTLGSPAPDENEPHSVHPTDLRALNNRGLAYLKLRKPEKARRDFEKALRIEPGFEQAKKNLES